MNVRRGEIWECDLNPVQGSEQGGIRPVLVIQNDAGNKHSPCTIVAAITSKTKHSWLPTHVKLSKEKSGLFRNSLVLLEQIRTIDKGRLMHRVSVLGEEGMEKVDTALCASLDLMSVNSAVV